MGCIPCCIIKWNYDASIVSVDCINYCYCFVTCDVIVDNDMLVHPI